MAQLAFCNLLALCLLTTNDSAFSSVLTAIIQCSCVFNDFQQCVLLQIKVSNSMGILHQQQRGSSREAVLLYATAKQNYNIQAHVAVSSIFV